MTTRRHALIGLLAMPVVIRVTQLMPVSSLRLAPSPLVTEFRTREMDEWWLRFGPYLREELERAQQ